MNLLTKIVVGWMIFCFLYVCFMYAGGAIYRKRAKSWKSQQNWSVIDYENQ